MSAVAARHRPSDGRGLPQALAWLTPYANGSRPWPFVEISPATLSPTIFTEIFRLASTPAAWAAAAPGYEATAMHRPGASVARANLVYRRANPV